MKNKYGKINVFKKRVDKSRQNELLKDFETQQDVGEMEASTNSIPDELMVDDTNVFVQPTADTDEEFTKRFVISNLDWDKINSVDLFVLANSFTPAQYRLRSVSIYQSKYGHQQLQIENEKGPDLQPFHEEAFRNELSANQQALKVYKQLKKEGETDTYQKISEQFPLLKEKIAQHRVRLYQTDRMNYYYAVLEFDSPQAAETVFNQINGIEFESVGCILNCLVLDDTTYNSMTSIPKFNESERTGGYLKEKTDEAPLQYKYSDEGRAAQLSTKPELAFDMPDKERAKMMKNLRLGDDFDQKQLEKYFNFEGSNDFQGEEIAENEEFEELDEFDYKEEKQKSLQNDESEEDIQDLLEKPKIEQKFKLKFTSNFMTNNKKEETPFQKYLNLKKSEWEFRTQQPKKEQEIKTIPKEIQSLYKKTVKQIKMEDDPRALKYLIKKKQKMVEKYPDLALMEDQSNQIVKFDDERFKEVFEGGQEFDADGQVGEEQRKRRDAK